MPRHPRWVDHARDRGRLRLGPEEYREPRELVDQAHHDLGLGVAEGCESLGVDVRVAELHGIRYDRLEAEQVLGEEALVRGGLGGLGLADGGVQRVGLVLDVLRHERGRWDVLLDDHGAAGDDRRVLLPQRHSVAAPLPEVHRVEGVERVALEPELVLGDRLAVLLPERGPGHVELGAGGLLAQHDGVRHVRRAGEGVHRGVLAVDVGQARREQLGLAEREAARRDQVRPVELAHRVHHAQQRLAVQGGGVAHHPAHGRHREHRRVPERVQDAALLEPHALVASQRGHLVPLQRVGHERRGQGAAQGRQP